MNNNKIAVVTGANRGIGYEVVRELSKIKGITVILTSRENSKGIKAVSNLKNEGITVDYFQLDVTDEKSIKGLEEYILKKYERLDILINNAGILLDENISGFEINEKIVMETMETNFYGPLKLCQSFIPLMKKNNYGRIVNFSSTMGALNEMGAGYLAYRTSKTAINVLTRVFSSEVNGFNILINSVCPGWVKTDMGGPNANRTIQQGADTAVWLALLPDNGPTGKFFRNREVIQW